MSNNFDNILQLGRDNKIDELRQLAISQGLKPHPRAKATTLAKAIIDHVTQPIPQQMKHPAEQPQAEAHLNTEQEIRTACAQFLDKEGFEARFRDDNTWHFRYKGAEDSGHMSVPMRVIKLKAMVVAQGAHKLRKMKFDNEEIIAA